MKHTFWTLFFLVATNSVVLHGQTPVGIGQWRVHYPYGNVHSMAFVNKKAYSANEISLFYYDTEDKSLNAISKKDGLTGIEISRLGSYKSELLLVGYADGNIDFVKDRSIEKFDAIQRANIIGSKSIRHFYPHGNKVYVSTDYGMSILDMDRKEVSDSYLNISIDGSINRFYASTLSSDGDSIFVASEKGVMVARVSPGVNLKDYNNWKLFGPANGLPAGNKRAIGRIGSIVYAGVNGNGVYYFDGSQWHPTTMTGNEIRNITSGETSAVVCLDNKTYKSSSLTDHLLYQYVFIYTAVEGVMDSGLLWLAESGSGIFYCENPSHIQTIKYPIGPFTKDVYRLKYIDEQVVNCRGGLSVSWGNIFRVASFMTLGREDVWESYATGSQQGDLPNGCFDLLDAAVHPSSGKWYFSTYGTGLIEWDKKNNTFVKKDPGNTASLQSFYYSGLATGKDGTVWVCALVNASDNKPFLYAIAPNGTYYSFKAQKDFGNLPQEIVIDNQSNKWMRFGGSGGVRGLMWFKEINRATGASQQINFDINNNSDVLPSTLVNTIDVDKTGQVWIGTDEGIAIFTNPAQISPNNIPKPYLPIVGGFPLFFDKRINCIKTDAANRKWVGTPDGVFLLSADGLETIYHFTKENSPMIDNNVNTITINEKTGEVFLGTDKGIISYRSDATTGEETHVDVRAFPNPVERGFDGIVGISGIANNARVKITDVAGKLTYETPSNGSTAAWNLKDYNGKRAAAGIYLIFCATDDGTERFVGKIVVLD